MVTPYYRIQSEPAILSRFFGKRPQSLGTASSFLKATEGFVLLVTIAIFTWCARGFDDHNDSGIYICAGCFAAGQQVHYTM